MASALTWMKELVTSLPPEVAATNTTSAATAASAFCAYYGLTAANKTLQGRQIRKRRRLPEYVSFSKNMVDTGLRPSAWENEVESPRKSLSGNDTDEIFFNGIDNRNKNSITIKLTRLNAKYAEVYMVVTLKDNHTFSTFTLPVNQVSAGQCRTKQKNHWKAGDLNIWCTNANRTYRICFNGLLRNVETGLMQHVSFSMRWATFTEFLDFYQYANEENESFMNQYEHFGCFRGTYRIGESQDVEMALWGVRNRKLSRPREEGKCTRLYFYTKNGTGIGITFYETGSSKKSILIGSLMAAKQVIYKIEFDKGTTDLILNLFKTGMTKLNFQADACKYEMYVGVEKQESQNGRTKVYPAKCSLKNVTQNWEYSGNGIFESETTDMDDFDSCSCNKILSEISQTPKGKTEDEALIGGKALSLKTLMKISREVGFEVPRASFVTTVTFKKHIERHPELNLLINSLNSTKNGKALDLEEKSKQIYELMAASKVSDEIKAEIASKLKTMFGDAFDDQLFSVRSSAVGEDGEEMSNAGQMDTFLGVKGIDKIIESVKKCWASCFSHRALQYRRQYGQLLTANMGVVIQEMVNAESAGVMFTREPLSGHPSVIMITSNKGLGESVVSGICQPDSIKLMKNHDDNSLSILEYNIGTKSSQIFLQDDGGVYEAEVADESEKSISDEMALALGKIGAEIEELMFEPKDIEWAIKGDTIYLLQSRPITTLNLETDFDVIHEFDTPLVTDHEVNNAGNIKEAIPHAASPLGRTHTFGLFISATSHQFSFLASPEICQVFGNQYKLGCMTSSHGHLFMARTDNIQVGSSTSVQQMMDIAMNGRVLNDQDVIKESQERFYGLRQFTIFNLPSIVSMYFNLDNYVKQLDELFVEDYDCNKFKTMEEVLTYLSDMTLLYQPSFLHMLSSMLSSNATSNITKELLRNTNMENANWPDVMSDLAKLLESSKEDNTVESVNIPLALQELVKIVSEVIDPEEYAKMSEKEALAFLTTNDSPVKSKYDAFIKRHGHRGLSEFDLYGEVWELFPTHLIKSTQVMMRSFDRMKETQTSSLDEAVNQLKSNISESRKKTLLKVTKNARKYVECREKSKSKMIKSIHGYRKAFLHLADMMVDAGMLPEQRLIFFFAFEEIEEFIATRCPRIMQRVMRRKRLNNYMHTLEFPEFVTGIIKPLEPVIRTDSGEASLELKGVPVCHGLVTAKARVCKSLEDAFEMQPGEILVARGTDVAWSPYFPIAAGVITELGGLVSHGAVVAREYGLPCVIDAMDATALLSTGDVITLNGSVGTISRISKVGAQQC